MQDTDRSRRHIGLVLVLSLLLIPGAAAQAVGGSQAEEALPFIDVSHAPDRIVALPAEVDAAIRAVFVYYTKVVAPNGKPIHILAQDGWTRDRIIKARNVLEHILRDVPGSKYGADKRLVANTMADQRATLVLFNTEPDMRAALRGPLGDIDLAMQDLRANEAPVEGSADYMGHGTRDASFEEVLHLVHDTGIKPALPEMQNDLRRITAAAIERGLWRANQDDLENEPNEYFAAIYDNYLDLWSVPPTVYEGRPIPDGRIPDGTSHFGIYGARGRAGLRERDAQGLAILQEFFPPYLTYTPHLPPDFEGTFTITHDPKLRYTAKSQHLANVTLRGNNPATLIGNGWDNRLTGNDGDNTLRGSAGDDLLDGGNGTDVAVYEGNAADYTVTSGVGVVRVVDHRVDRDGSDTLLNIETIRFADGNHEIGPAPATASVFVLAFGVTTGTQESELPEPPFTFVGNATSTGTVMGGSSRLQMTITRWSTDQEQQLLQGAVAELGQQGVVAALDSFEQMGFARTGTGVGDPIQYARATRVEGGWTILMATTRPMGVFETYFNTRTTNYPLTLIELHVDENGNGSGSAAIGVELKRDRSGRMVLERWDTQPIQLGNVKLR